MQKNLRNLEISNYGTNVRFISKMELELYKIHIYSLASASTREYTVYAFIITILLAMIVNNLNFVGLCFVVFTQLIISTKNIPQE